jgi:hypothetical protein
MSQQSEIPSTDTTRMAVICGGISWSTSKTGSKQNKCSRTIYLDPAVDPNFLIGSCSKCGHSKVVRIRIR